MILVCVLGEIYQLKFHPFNDEKTEQLMVFTESKGNLLKLKDEYISEKFVDTDEDNERRVIVDIHWTDDEHLDCSQYTAITAKYDMEFYRKETELCLSAAVYGINDQLTEMLSILRL